MDAKDYELLYRSLDGPLTDEEARRLRLLLAVSPEAQREQRRLQSIRAAVATRSERAFAGGFADRVMTAISAEQEAARALPDGPGLLDRLQWWIDEHRRAWQVLAGSMATAVVVLAVGIGWWFTPTTVEVLPGQTAAVTLPDGSDVELAGGSTLRYRWRPGDDTRRLELEGQAFFDVETAPQPFVVEAFNATVTVTGTRFNVAAWPDDPERETVVTVEEGSVRVAARPTEAIEDEPMADEANGTVEAFALSPSRIASHVTAVDLRAGETTVVASEAPTALEARPADVDRALFWRTGGLWFKNEPLGGIVRRLERRYGVGIALTSPGLDERRLTYQHPAPPQLAAVLTDICQSLGLRYRRTAEGYEIFQP